MEVLEKRPEHQSCGRRYVGLKHYIAELHVHSSCSDGWLEPEMIPGIAKKKGLDIVAVTDHNSIEGGIRAEKARHNGCYVIPGIEVSLPRAHILGYFLRRDIKSQNFQDVVKEIKSQGGIAVWAHPVHYPIFGRFRGKQPLIPKPEELSLFNAIEVYNGRNSKKGNKKIFDLCKTNGVFSCIAGSDAHFPFEIGRAKTIFEMNNLNEEEIKGAFRQGRVFLANGLKSCRICYFVTGILNKLKGQNY